jgi:ABC-type sulfate/molybdate transport systems ATPase subunit
LTGKFISHDSEFVSDALDYLIINNAGAVTDIGISDESMTKNTEFIIKSVKVYQ